MISEFLFGKLVNNALKNLPINKYKKPIKNVIINMRALLAILFVVITFFNSHAIHIQGTVVDLKDNAPLPYTNIVLKSNYQGVISDEHGNFKLELNQNIKKDTLIVSYIGYQVKHIPISKTIDTIKLEPLVFKIKEVVITPISIENILKQTHEKFFENHIHLNTVSESYYREQIFDNNECIRFGEAVYKTYVYKKEKENLAITIPYLARSIEDSIFLHKVNHIFNNRRELVKFGIDNIFTGEISEGFNLKNYHKFMGEIFFDQKKDGFKIKYDLKESENVKGRETYLISFDVTKKGIAIADGHLLIDKENYGIAGFGIKFREEENLTRLLIPPRFKIIMKLLGYSVRINSFEAKLYNKYRDGKWFIGDAIQILEIDVAKRGKWVHGKLINEIYELNNTQHNLTAKELEKKVKFKDVRTNDFSYGFWKPYMYAPLQPIHHNYISKIKASNQEFTGSIYTKKVNKRKNKQKKNVVE